MQSLMEFPRESTMNVKDVYINNKNDPIIMPIKPIFKVYRSSSSTVNRVMPIKLILKVYQSRSIQSIE
jgi:hypothetical protein